jgi:SAM-dependent methyltransferase
MNNRSYALNFWEHKILSWETFRYSKWLILYPFSWTVRNRLNLASKIIISRIRPDWCVLELGCGSGYLASRIALSTGKYIGVDIAANAIEHARIKNNYPHIQFIASDIKDYNFDEQQIVVFLGLTDWLEDNELRALFAKLQSDNVLFSYTESKVVSFWNPYKYYREIMDRKSKKSFYKARTYSEEKIKKILMEFGYSFEFIKTASLFDPGALVWAKK